MNTAPTKPPIRKPVTHGPPPIFWRTVIVALGIFSLAMSFWAIRAIMLQRLWVPLGLRRGLVLEGNAAIVGGAAILCGVVCYIAHEGLRMLDGWEYAAERITRLFAASGLLLAIIAFVLQAL